MPHLHPTHGGDPLPTQIGRPVEQAGVPLAQVGSPFVQAETPVLQVGVRLSLPQDAPAAQAIPQAPQFLGSVAKLVQNAPAATPASEPASPASVLASELASEPASEPVLEHTPPSALPTGRGVGLRGSNAPVLPP